jgi:hypothetical protein
MQLGSALHRLNGKAQFIINVAKESNSTRNVKNMYREGAKNAKDISS